MVESALEDATLLALPAGTHLGRYIVRAELGAGGMGVVYLAEESETGREVALKTLPELEPAALYRFKREFRALADVTHPNLVALYELASEGDQWFFAMELVLGQDFLTWVRGGRSAATGAQSKANVEAAAPLSLDRAQLARLRHGLRQIVLGLRCVHGAGKIHCDLKPPNVLVTNDDRVVILDFGLVRERPRLAVETTGEFFGTALYMAPEQARSRRVGPTADWYAVGVMLYKLLTGKSPFRGGPMEILYAKQDTEPAAPQTLVPDVPDDLNELCVALLHCAPAARPGSSEILEMLGAPVEEESAQPRVDTSTFQLGETFVGRALELATLRRAFEASRQEAVALFVRGESGVGKTALARRFLEAVRTSRSDAVVLEGRCYQRESVPYRAFDSVVDELSEYLRRLDQVDAALLMPTDASLLARVFPVLGRVPAIARAVDPGPEVRAPQDLRTRVFNSLRELLRRIAECAPVVVFVDDLQWADADGLALIAEVLHGPDAPALLFVATVRSDRGEPLPAHLGEVAAEIRQVVDLPVGALPPEFAVELAELLFERTGTDDLTDAAEVAANAAGHPQFIDELVHFLSSSPGGLGHETGLDDALWARFERLEAPARALLQTLAVAEVPLPAETACRAAGVLGEGDRLVRVLAGEHLIRSVPMSSGAHALEPYHERVRETVLGRLDESTKVEHHRRLADALQEAGAALHDPQALVRHLVSAGEEARAAEQAAEAGRRADAALGFDQASELYRVALRLGAYSESKERDVRAQLAEALINAGRGVEAASELIALARSAENKAERIDCQRRAAQQLLLNGHIEPGLEVLDAVAAEFGLRIPASPRRALLSYLWSRLRLRARGVRWKQRDESEIPNRALMELDLYHALGTILSLVDTVRGQALLARSVLLALKLGERDRVVRALSTEAASAVAVGDRRRAAKSLAESRRLADVSQDPVVQAWSLGTRGIAAFMAGRFQQALPLLERGLSLRAVIDPKQRSRLATGGAYEANAMHSYRLMSLAYLGDCARLRREFHEFVRDARRRGDRFSAATAARGLNIVWLFEDEPERARRELEEESWTPPSNTYHIQNFLALRSMATNHLYCGTAREGREEIQPDIDALERSLLLRIVPVRVEWTWLIGRLALAEIDGGAEAPGRLKLALKMARKLVREGLAHATVAAVMLRAAVFYVRGQRDRAIGELARAEATAVRGGLKLIAATAHRRRGQLFGGEEGEQVIEAADRWMASEAIRDPEKITRMYAPGFDAKPRAAASPARLTGGATIRSEGKP